MPKISVIIPVYNTALFLKEALDSIINQTIRDIEIIAIDDCSTDNSFDILKEYAQKDSRIVVVKNEQNLGIAGTLNKCIDLAKGEFIARMDNDDIAHPKRFQVQLEFLEKNPNIAICGSAIRKFGKVNRTVKLPTSPEKIKANLCFNCCIMHPTVMMRSDFIQKHNLRYDIQFNNSEDFELWTRCVQLGDIANIPKPLLKYRVHSKSISNSKEQEQATKALAVRKKQFERYFGVDFDLEKLRLLFDAQKLNENSYDDFKSICAELVELNKKHKSLDPKWFEFYLSQTATKTLKKKFNETKQLFYLQKIADYNKTEACILTLKNIFRIKK